MKKRTLITLIVFLSLGAIWFIWSSVSFKKDLEKAKELDVTVAFNEEEFSQAIKSDGTIYALGQIYGAVDTDHINFADLEFKGKDKEEKVEQFKASVLGKEQEYLYLKIFSVQVSTVVDKEKNKEDYVRYSFIPYSNSLEYVADNFTLYAQEFPLNENLVKSIGGLSQSYVPEKDREHFIRAEYLKSGASVWVEFEILNGELVKDSLNLHSDYSYFDTLAREISGESKFSIGLNLLSIIVIALILFGITTLIQRKFCKN